MLSEENVEIVRGLVDAYLRGDLDQALTRVDPEVVYKRAEERRLTGERR